VSLPVVAARDQKWRVASDKSGLLSRGMKILKMSCSEVVKSGEAVEGDEADEGLPVDSDASVSMSSFLSRQW